MSSSAIKAGEAYVAITTRDGGFSSGLKAFENQTQTFLKAIGKHAQVAQAQAARSGIDASYQALRGLREQKSQLEAEFKASEKRAAKTYSDLKQGKSEVDRGTARAAYREMNGIGKQLAAVEEQINALLAQQTQLRQAASQAEQESARQQQIRLARAKEYTDELRRQATSQAQQHALGQQGVTRSLSRAAAADKIGGVATVAEAQRLQTILEKQRTTINGQVSALMAEVKEMRQAGASEAARAPLAAKIRELMGQRRETENQINQLLERRERLVTAEVAAESQQLAQEKAVTAEEERQAHLADIRNQKQQAYLHALSAAAQTSREQAGIGQQGVTRALSRAAAADKIGGVSTVPEAQRLQGILEKQRAALQGQVSALMAEVKEMRQAGASEAARAPLAAKIRELIAARKQVEEQINAVMARRAGIQSSEAAQAAAAVQQQATALSAYNRSAGLSEATTRRFHLTLTNANRVVNQSRAGFGGAAGGMARFNQVGTQVAFLGDDLMAGYGMGGVAGALRATSNNVQMLLVPFGGWIALAGTAVMIGAQLALAFNKQSDATKQAAENTDLMTAALDRMIQKEEFLAKLKQERDLGTLTNQGQDKQTDLAATTAALEKIKQEREIQEANVTRLENKRTGVTFTGGETRFSKDAAQAAARQEQLAAQIIVARQKVNETAEKEAELLDKQARIKEEIAAIDQRRKKLSDDHIAQLNLQARLTREAREVNKSYLADQQEREKAKVLAKFDKRIQEELGAMRKDLVREVNPQRAERNDILSKMLDRLGMARLESDPRRRIQIETEIKQSALKQLQQLERNSAARGIENELFGELGKGTAGRRKSILDQGTDRARTILDEAAAGNISPQRRKELLEGIKRSQALQLAGTFSADRRAHANVANTALDARSAEGIRAVLAATTGRKSQEEKLLEKMAAGVKLQEQEKKQLDDLLTIWSNATPLTATPAGS